MGSIAVSDGHSTSIVNLQGCQTIGDVAARIRANPPANRSLDVEVTGTGLVISLDPDPAGGFPASQDNLSVREVGGGTTAADLGILQPARRRQRAAGRQRPRPGPHDHDSARTASWARPPWPSSAGRRQQRHPV